MTSKRLDHIHSITNPLHTLEESREARWLAWGRSGNRSWKVEPNRSALATWALIPHLSTFQSHAGMQVAITHNAVTSLPRWPKVSLRLCSWSLEWSPTLHPGASPELLEVISSTFFFLLPKDVSLKTILQGQGFCSDCNRYNVTDTKWCCRWTTLCSYSQTARPATQELSSSWQPSDNEEK